MRLLKLTEPAARKGRLSLWHMRSTRQRGDTIVEVLVAIAVVSLVLTGAYVTTNHSLIDTRAAQERGDALKLAESQLEELRSLAATNNAVFTQTSPFCLYNITTITPATSANCTVNAAGSPTNTQPAYHQSISEGSSNTFTVSLWWYNVSGNTKQQLQMSYRLYQ